jgi:hypothetical protein
LAIAAAACSLAVGTALAQSGSGSSDSGVDDLALFVTGSLADADGETVGAKKAVGQILAINGGGDTGIKTIEVAVDGNRAALDRVRCGGGCPTAERFSFTYQPKRYGPSGHEIEITATTGAGHHVSQKIKVKRRLSGAGAPTPVPAFYMTAPDAKSLVRQSKHAGSLVARKQDAGHTLLVLDYGAARLKDGDYGTSLRGGPFFSNDQIKTALQAAADAHSDDYRRGSVTIVYANTNGHISEKKEGYTTLDEDTARKAGEAQAGVIADLKLHAHQKSAVGGDIEPGYDPEPKLSIAMVEGAVDAAKDKPYYNFGTAPCKGKKCKNGWLVEHLCKVTAGASREPLPEIYDVSPVDQAAVWTRVQKSCGIKSFAGSSANLLAQLTPRQSWVRLNQKVDGHLGDSLVVWPK